MKPISLKIKGLNSFYDEQIIDFRKLTDKGIFGIFGPTGSGKSTIIDAITIALYGEISRYDGVKGNKEFINTNSENMVIYFEFEINCDNERNIYVVEREYKRKADGSVKASAARLYKKNNDIKVIADKPKEVSKEIIKIVGLTYDDFTRAVILPQGKFSKFLMLINEERRDMLERIFGLEKYGRTLLNNINDEKNFQKCLIDKINNEIELYGDISFEKIEEEKNNYTCEKNEIYNKNEEFKNKNDLVFKYKNLIQLRDEYLLYLDKKKDILHKYDDIKEKENILLNAKKADTVFPYIKSLEDTEEKLIKNEKLLKQYLKQYDDIEKELNEKKELYKNIFDIKELKSPVLIKTQINLKEALELEEEKEIISHEYLELNEKYKLNSEKLFKLKTTIDKENSLFNDIDDNLKFILDEKNKINIDIKYKNDIEASYNNKKRYDEIILNINSENENLKLKSDNIKKSGKELKQIDDEFLKLNEKYNIVSEALRNIIETCPENNDELIKLKESIMKKENFLDLNVEKKNMLQKKTKEFSEYKISIKSEQEYYQSICQKINNIENNIKEIDIQLKVFENRNVIMLLSSQLQDEVPCPVCGSFSHPKPAQQIADNINENLYNKKESYLKEYKKLEEEKQNINIKINSERNIYINLEKEIINIKEELGTFDIEKEQNNIIIEKENFNILKNKIEKWKIDKEYNEKQINEYKDKIQTLTIKAAAIKKEISKDNESLEDIKIKAEKFQNEKINLMNILDSYTAKYKIYDFKEEYKKIKEYESKKYELEEKQNILQVTFKEKSDLISNLKNSINSIESDIKNNLSIIEERKNNIEKLNKKITFLSEGKNPKKYLIEIEKEIAEIKEKESTLKISLENTENIKQIAYQEKINLSKENQTFKQLKDEQEKNLKLCMNENNFYFISEVKNALLDKEKQQKIENEINKYKDLSKEIQNNINRINQNIKDEDIEDLDLKFINIKNEIDELKENLDKKNKNLALMFFKISEMEKNIIKFSELQNKLKKEQHKYDLLYELSSLTSGNKFVEFIAVKQLKYITHEASLRLKDMSNGRYSLELDGPNFVIRDDFNGGARRTPKTLSGGETFLASLSLALALSSKIQLKNKAPLEIFFLDEGFGTLDSELLDTVMNSLEHLHIEKINVGIITHVEELKNRVQSKVIIKPPYGNFKGSKIIVE